MNILDEEEQENNRRKRNKLNRQPSIEEILSKSSLHLSPNLDKTLKLTHKRPNDKLMMDGSQLKKYNEMPTVKITKKKEENQKLEKILEALQPVKRRGIVHRRKPALARHQSEDSIEHMSSDDGRSSQKSIHVESSSRKKKNEPGL